MSLRRLALLLVLAPILALPSAASAGRAADIVLGTLAGTAIGTGTGGLLFVTTQHDASALPAFLASGGAVGLAGGAAWGVFHTNPYATVAASALPVGPFEVNAPVLRVVREPAPLAARWAWRADLVRLAF